MVSVPSAFVEVLGAGLSVSEGEIVVILVVVSGVTVWIQAIVPDTVFVVNDDSHSGISIV